MTTIKRLFRQREFAVAALLALTFVLVALKNPVFLSPGNIGDILMSNVPFFIMACGLTFIIVLGEIDISVGALYGFLAVVMGTLASTDRMARPVWQAVAAVLALGLFVGLVNGALVVWGRVPSIIVTLGMMTALQGAIEVVRHGQEIQGLPDALRWLGIGKIAGVPFPLLVAIVVAICCAVMAVFSPLGRRLYATGSNPHAAKLAGLRVNGIKLFAFALSGLLTAIAMLVTVPRVANIATEGHQYELTVVTAVVVGGTALAGGRGTIIGSMLAVLLLGAISTAITLLKLEGLAYWEKAIHGAFILLAVLADHLMGRDKEGA